jgi:hypothetical protein
MFLQSIYLVCDSIIGRQIFRYLALIYKRFEVNTNPTLGVETHDLVITVTVLLYSENS